VVVLNTVLSAAALARDDGINYAGFDLNQSRGSRSAIEGSNLTISCT
jgi:hypothetical protein